MPLISGGASSKELLAYVWNMFDVAQVKKVYCPSSASKLLYIALDSSKEKIPPRQMVYFIQNQGIYLK